MPFSQFHAYATDALAPHGIASSVTPEEQSSEYEAGLATIGTETWHIRTARITPTKPGAFVAFWQRTESGETAPFPTTDVAAGLIVFVADSKKRGLMRFDRAMLQELGITSSASRPGKRGFRIYPAWCDGLNPQARATQRAQAPAFSEW